MSSEAVPEVGRSKPAMPARFFLVVAIALLLLKLLLVSRREMAPEAHDAEAYASASMQQLGSVFSADAYHPPGASLVMAMARSLGVPYRIFIEVFLALAAFLFLRPLVASMRLGVIAVALSYALLLFHPNLILEMDRPMSDSVSFLCWLIGAGGIIGIVAAPRERLPLWSLGLVIVSFAFAGITRSGEGTLFFVEMVAVAFLSVLLFRGADGGVAAARSSPASARSSPIWRLFKRCRRPIISKAAIGARARSRAANGGGSIAPCFRFRFSAPTVMS